MNTSLAGWRAGGLGHCRLHPAGPALRLASGAEGGQVPLQSGPARVLQRLRGPSKVRVGKRVSCQGRFWST